MVSTAPATTAHEARRTGTAPRADIQALRALAVGLVLVYHFRPDWLPGGFIGVDVFFVISGYLITSHLVREAGRNGRISLASFWAARARRILPAALVTIAVTAVATLAVLPATQRAQLTREALASIFYVQNWQLAADSVDYLAAENVASPFQHFWTLAVEEQFYLGWPLLVVLALAVIGTVRGARLADDATRRLTRTLAVLFGTVCLASFVWGAIAVADRDPSAYFATTTRVWELGIGGLLSLVLTRRAPTVLRGALVALGLAAILIASFRLTGQSPFPGLAALAPVLGSAAVIAAGAPVRAAHGGVEAAGPLPGWSRLAAMPFAQWVGDRSYSIYLWHFPLVVVFLATEGTPRAVEVVALALATAILAAASYRWVEQPARRSPFLLARPSRTLVLAGVAMLATTAVVLVSDRVGTNATSGHDELAESVTTGQHGGMLAPTAPPPTSSPTTSPTAPGTSPDALPEGEVVAGLQSKKASGWQALLPAEPLVKAYPGGDVAMSPAPLDAGSDRDTVFSDGACIADQREATTPGCDRGNPDSGTSIVLVGDSHARMFAGPLVRLAEDRDWHLRTYLHNSCPFSPTPREREAAGSIKCTEPNAQVMAEILELEPDIVVTTWLGSSTFVPEPEGGVPGAHGMAAYWNELEAAGIDVVVLRDAPRADKELHACLVENYEDPESCGHPPDYALTGGELLESALDMAPDADLLDLTPLYCSQDLCRYVVGGILTHRDHNHVTETWALSVQDHLAVALETVVARD